ncbi:MAG: zinc-ribbon domain-containing protein, partial [Candidatus Thorarchaeota archaeon]
QNKINFINIKPIPYKRNLSQTTHPQKHKNHIHKRFRQVQPQAQVVANEFKANISESGIIPSSKSARPTFCPYCGNKIDPDEIYCMICGKEINLLFDSDKSFNQNSKKLCHHCNAKLSLSDIYCPECGQKV